MAKDDPRSCTRWPASMPKTGKTKEAHDLLLRGMDE